MLAKVYWVMFSNKNFMIGPLMLIMIYFKYDIGGSS